MFYTGTVRYPGTEFFSLFLNYSKYKCAILVTKLTVFQLIFKIDRENRPPSPGGGGISANVICGENMKRGREKGGKCTRKGKKWERKRENGPSKRVN
jgi:hypothetical protein